MDKNHEKLDMPKIPRKTKRSKLKVNGAINGSTPELKSSVFKSLDEAEAKSEISGRALSSDRSSTSNAEKALPQAVKPMGVRRIKNNMRRKNEQFVDFLKQPIPEKLERPVPIGTFGSKPNSSPLDSLFEPVGGKIEMPTLVESFDAKPASSSFDPLSPYVAGEIQEPIPMESFESLPGDYSKSTDILPDWYLDEIKACESQLDIMEQQLNKPLTRKNVLALEFTVDLIKDELDARPNPFGLRAFKVLSPVYDKLKAIKTRINQLLECMPDEQKALSEFIEILSNLSERFVGRKKNVETSGTESICFEICSAYSDLKDAVEYLIKYKEKIPENQACRSARSSFTESVVDYIESISTRFEPSLNMCVENMCKFIPAYLPLIKKCIDEYFSAYPDEFSANCLRHIDALSEKVTPICEMCDKVCEYLKSVPLVQDRKDKLIKTISKIGDTYKMSLCEQLLLLAWTAEWIWINSPSKSKNFKSMEKDKKIKDVPEILKENLIAFAVRSEFKTSAKTLKELANKSDFCEKIQKELTKYLKIYK